LACFLELKILYIYNTVIYGAQVRSYLDGEALDIKATFLSQSFVECNLTTR